MSYSIDLNSDVGESYGVYALGNDEALMPLISSANIACGFHAGDPRVMRKTIQLALEHQVAIGGHPGLPDLNGFGRREMTITPEEAYELIIYQLGALQALTKAEGGVVRHVKPHGALYNMAAANSELAYGIAKAIYAVDSSLIVYGLSGSALLQAGKEIGLQTASEVFADRTYQRDGSLTKRSEVNAQISDPDQASEQVIKMVTEGEVQTLDGQTHSIQADTVCIHGDGLHGVAFAQSVRQRLLAKEISIEAIRKKIKTGGDANA